jgi:hypothetical protein
MLHPASDTITEMGHAAWCQKILWRLACVHAVSRQFYLEKWSMKRTPLLLFVAALLGFGVGTLMPTLLAAPPHALYAPIIQTTPDPSICSPAQPLLITDISSFDAGIDSAGRYIISYIDRTNGSRAHVAQHLGSALVELAAPALSGGPAAAEPAFSPAGPKQGAVAMVLNVPGHRNRLYYTQRQIGDTTGPYALWCMEF